MAPDDVTYNLDDLSRLTDIPRRTVRYYIQTGLLDKPTGVGRGSHYTQRHLLQLLEIRKWQAAGLSLERIQDLLHGEGADGLLPPTPAKKPGDVAVVSHVYIDEGIELTIDPTRAALSPEQVRALARRLMAQYRRIRNENGDD